MTTKTPQSGELADEYSSDFTALASSCEAGERYSVSDDGRLYTTSRLDGAPPEVEESRNVR